MIFLKNKVLLIAYFVFFVFNQNSFCKKDTDNDQLLSIYNNNYPKTDSAQYNLLYKLANQLSADSSLPYTEKLINKAQGDKNYLWCYKGQMLKGNALFMKGKLETAIKAYFQCADYAKKANYINGLGKAYLSLGNTYFALNNHINSIIYYKIAIKTFRTLNDSTSLGNCLFNIGTEYLKVFQIDTSLLYLKEAQQILRNLGDEKGIACTIGNIGFALGFKGDLKNAENNILLATKMLNNLGDTYLTSSYLTHLAQIYKEQKCFEKAEIYALKSLEISKKYEYTSRERDVFFELSDINELKRNYKNAYKYHLLYISYRDSINNNESTQKIADLRTTYEVAQKQTEIDLLNKRKNIQRIVAGSLGGLVIISGIFGFVTYRNNRKTKALNNLLHEQKEELLAQHEQLEGLNKTKDRFFSIISHDLRGPIGSIGSLPELFKEYIALNEIHEISELVVSMDTSVRQVSTLLDNLLEWALSQQGTFPYHPDKIYLNKVTEEVFSIFSAMAEAKGIVLKEAVTEEIYVIADKNSLMTILRNLISNAIKFCNHGDTIIISARIHGKMAMITVEDSGIGMSQEKLKTLFQLNEKKSTWGTENEKGLGIGLNLVHEFVLMNNGTIEVVSEEKVGSTFIVKIPLLIDKPLADAQPAVV